MERFIRILGGIAMLFCLTAAVVEIGLVVCICIDAFISKGNYSYVTDNGASGDADFCDNGRGGLYCTKDGRTFTVKEYSRK